MAHTIKKNNTHTQTQTQLRGPLQTNRLKQHGSKVGCAFDSSKPSTRFALPTYTQPSDAIKCIRSGNGHWVILGGCATGRHYVTWIAVAWFWEGQTVRVCVCANTDRHTHTLSRPFCQTKSKPAALVGWWAACVCRVETGLERKGCNRLCGLFSWLSFILSFVFHVYYLTHHRKHPFAPLIHTHTRTYRDRIFGTHTRARAIRVRVCAAVQCVISTSSFTTTSLRPPPYVCPSVLCDNLCSFAGVVSEGEDREGQKQFHFQLLSSATRSGCVTEAATEVALPLRSFRATRG